MMIPKNITRDHVLKALEKIDNEGVDENRQSSKYYLMYKNREYPPKYTVACANFYANGEFLNSELFSGGAETNNFLKKLGFEINE